MSVHFSRSNGRGKMSSFIDGIAPITMVLINDESQHKRIPTIACADNFKQATEAHQ